MAQNADYTQEYFDLMESLDGDIIGRRKAFAYMRQSTAIVHHEVVASSFVPRLYGKKTFEKMNYVATTAHKILCKVVENYINNPPYREIFSFDARLEELILLPRGYDSLLPFIRVDIFLDENDLSCAFCEFNADGSSGMNEDREIAASIAGSASFSEFAKRHNIHPSELFETWVDEFLEIYGTYIHRTNNPQIAICDFLENAVIDEFKIFAEIFKSRGINCSIYDVRDLRFDGESLRGSDGNRIDAIWRRSVTNDIIEHWDESQQLIEAVRAQKVALIGSFAGHLIHDKQIFRALFNPATQAFLTEEEKTFIDETIPYTTFLDSNYIDLEKVRGEKDRWIIKPTDHYGADEVHAGLYWNQSEWEALIDKFANQAAGMPFLAQTYCTPHKTMILPADTAIESQSDAEVPREGQMYNNLMGLYLYNGKFAGVFSRLGPNPIICKDMGGITAATIWVDL